MQRERRSILEISLLVPPRPFFEWPRRRQESGNTEAARPDNAPPDDARPTDAAELADHDIERLQARVAELEAERDESSASLFADVLRLPGIREALLKGFHPDKHPRASEAERKGFGDAIAKINAAYEILERDI